MIGMNQAAPTSTTTTKNGRVMYLAYMPTCFESSLCNMEACSLSMLVDGWMGSVDFQ